MIQALQSAIAGLRVSAERLGVAANNIANVRSSGGVDPYDGYVPQTLEQSTNAQGLPTSSVGTVSPAFYPVYDPNNSRANADGLVGYPNVDLAANIVDMKIAEQSYKANMVTIRAASDMMKVLLDETA